MGREYTVMNGEWGMGVERRFDSYPVDGIGSEMVTGSKAAGGMGGAPFVIGSASVPPMRQVRPYLIKPCPRFLSAASCSWRSSPPPARIRPPTHRRHRRLDRVQKPRLPPRHHCPFRRPL